MGESNQALFLQVSMFDIVLVGAKREILFSMACIGEAACEDAENLAGVGCGQHLYARDPFDPFKASAAWGD